MNNHLFRLKKLVFLLLLSQLFAACAAQQGVLDLETLKKQYHSAVIDATMAEPSEISKNLVAIIPTNEHLIWKNKTDSLNAKILVVTWTNYNGYDEKIGQSVTLSRDTWVTTVPEVKNFCKHVKNKTPLRLEQLLGLPPNSGKTKFVEMWVRPGDLFRPSADPEISDTEAETDFRTPNAYIKVSDTYKKWYSNLKSQSYGENGYPWTRLGYTYDWADEKNNIGISEFVIMPGSTIEIHTISSTMEYLK